MTPSHVPGVAPAPALLRPPTAAHPYPMLSRRLAYGEHLRRASVAVMVIQQARDPGGSPTLSVSASRQEPSGQRSQACSSMTDPDVVQVRLTVRGAGGAIYPPGADSAGGVGNQQCCGE